MTQADTRPKLWIDITELFGQFAAMSHPTGVSRVVIGLADALRAAPGEHFAEASLLFWDQVGRRALTSRDPAIACLAGFLPGLGARYRAARLAGPPRLTQPLKGLLTAIPTPLRYRIFPWNEGVRQFVRYAARTQLAVQPATIRAGDVVFLPGSFWLGGYAPRLVAETLARGAALSAFIHDVIVLSHPDWWRGEDVRQFRAGLEAVLPACGAIICNSRHTAATLGRQVALGPKAAISVSRLADVWPAAPDAPAPAAPGVPGPYALFVASLNARKNHALLVEAWLRLAALVEGPVPALVFAGGGAPGPELAQRIAEARRAGLDIRHLPGLGDDGIDRLYRGAWLTVFPSLVEGYGLPVAEALARGRHCLAVASGGVGDIAPDLVEAIDPADPDDLARRLAAYLREPARLAAREALIRSGYRPTSWADTAASVRAALETMANRCSA